MKVFILILTLNLIMNSNQTYKFSIYHKIIYIENHFPVKLLPRYFQTEIVKENVEYYFSNKINTSNLPNKQNSNSFHNYN